MTLRDWLAKVKLSVTSFAYALGMDRSYVHMLMAGTRSPSAKMMKRIEEITMGHVSKVEELLDNRRQNGKKEIGSESGSASEKNQSIQG